MDAVDVQPGVGRHRGRLRRRLGRTDGGAVKPLAEVTLDERGPVVVAHVDGEVDLSNVDDIRTLLVDAVVARRPSASSST